MTLGEYYNFPSGIEPQMKGIPHWLEEHPNFPCPADMSFSFAYSSISMLYPLDTSNVTNMGYMFSNCKNLISVGLDLETNNVTQMNSMFSNCTNLTKVDLSNWDTSNVKSMDSMFNYCSKLKSISSINCSGISTKNYYPIYNINEFSVLTDVGGFIGMKMSWDNTYGLVKCPNLTYESCINILNGLYDFTGNNQTPTSSQGKLKVHSNFLTLVGDEISIGTGKGWVVTA